MVKKIIEYIFGLISFILIMSIFLKWAGYVVAKDDWLVFIAGFIVLWFIIYIVFKEKK